MRLALLFGMLGMAACHSCPYRKVNHEPGSHDKPAQPSSFGFGPVSDGEGVMLMNRMSPSTSELYIANTDGTDERLLLGNLSSYEYHASFSPDGQYVAFTSERNGDGNSDIYMVHVNGTGLTPIATTPAVEDAVAISPDGRFAAYASTRAVYTSNIWLTDLVSGETRNLTNQTGITGRPDSPSGFFAPSWSPDGQWIVFSSDRNTRWSNAASASPPAWEHTQNLSIYTIRPNGTDFRVVYSDPLWTVGSPKFSPDGQRIIFYQIGLEDTLFGRLMLSAQETVSQIASVDFATGRNYVQHTNNTGLKINPQYVTADNIGYLVKGGSSEGVHYTVSNLSISGEMRSPAWSPDGKLVVYQKQFWGQRPKGKKLWSWSPGWEYRFWDAFVTLSHRGALAYTSKVFLANPPGNASIMSANAAGADPEQVFDALATNQLNASDVLEGPSGGFAPQWSTDGKWIAFGLGNWLQDRETKPGWIYRVSTNGSWYEQLTDSEANSGFPSYSLDGRHIVYRDFGAAYGLRLLDLETRNITVLTTQRDNLPSFSPDGEWIVFTRNVTDPAIGEFSNYEICKIRPDGTGFTRLTTSAANDAHGVWTHDGRIIWSSGMWGFQAEAVTYDDNFQPYGQIMIMNADGTNQSLLTNGIWEDALPQHVHNSLLRCSSEEEHPR